MSEEVSPREVITRYRRFMALTTTLNNLIKKMEFLDIASGVTFRAVTDNGGHKYKSSKADIAQCYALGKYFKTGELAKLEKELGTKWKDIYSDSGLY